MTAKTLHQDVIDSLMRAIDQYPVDVVLEAGLTILGKLAANMRETRLVSECSLMLAFTDAMEIAYTPSEVHVPGIRLRREQETLQ